MSDVVVVGSFVQDLAFRTESFPKPGETRIGTFLAGPGGKGFNQAVACRRLGVQTKFVGAVGEDIFGRGAEQFAAQEGISAAWQRVASLPSGAASIVIDSSAQNAIVVALGANSALEPAFVEAAVRGESRSRVVVTQLECSLPAVLRALESGRNIGALCVLNPAPINADATAEIFSAADILVPNETELAYFLQHCFSRPVAADVAVLSDSELHSHCRVFANSTVVVTLGENGCFVSHPDRRPRWAEADALAYYRIPALKVDAVDTTGAGDAFTGGLAAGLVLFPGEFARAVRFANVTAALAVQKPGTAPAMPPRAEVDNIFLKLED